MTTPEWPLLILSAFLLLLQAVVSLRGWDAGEPPVPGPHQPSCQWYWKDCSCEWTVLVLP